MQGSVKADVCIIGGGYLGLWSAIRLKKGNPALSIVIVERDRCGAGASGRNGGDATNWWAKYLSLVSICGEAEARRICEAADSAIDEIGAFCAEHGVDAQYRKEGWLWAASNTGQIGSWHGLVENLPTAGVDYHVPFGGNRGSSLGPREQGTYARQFFTRVKTSYQLA